MLQILACTTNVLQLYNNFALLVKYMSYYTYYIFLTSSTTLVGNARGKSGSRRSSCRSAGRYAQVLVRGEGVINDSRSFLASPKPRSALSHFGAKENDSQLGISEHERLLVTFLLARTDLWPLQDLMATATHAPHVRPPLSEPCEDFSSS